MISPFIEGVVFVCSPKVEPECNDCFRPITAMSDWFLALYLPTSSRSSVLCFIGCPESLAVTISLSPPLLSLAFAPCPFYRRPGCNPAVTPYRVKPLNPLPKWWLAGCPTKHTVQWVVVSRIRPPYTRTTHASYWARLWVKQWVGLHDWSNLLSWELTVG